MNLKKKRYKDFISCSLLIILYIFEKLCNLINYFNRKIFFSHKNTNIFALKSLYQYALVIILYIFERLYYFNCFQLNLNVFRFFFTLVCKYDYLVSFEYAIKIWKGFFAFEYANKMIWKGVFLH